MWACKRVMIVGALSLLAGCKDPGALDLRLCETLEREDELEKAIEVCERATQRAAWWGGTKKEADGKLAELRPKFEPWKKARQEKEARVIAANKVARAKAVAEAKRVVRRKTWNFGERNSQCTAEGRPPYRFDYEGGTYQQNELVATADGCVHLFQSQYNANIYCCPT